VSSWPDIIIGAIAILSAYNGFRRGFVKELSGYIALFFALVTPWFYNGSLDGGIAASTHLGPGSSHVIGMFLTGIVTYAILIGLSFALDRIAHLPILSIVNTALGVVVGLIKAAVFCWFLLYVALFFPLSPDIRADLHRSPAVSFLTAPNDMVDRTVLSIIPWFMRPIANPYFWHHHP
jgi:membrane protein required for colicin V production